MSDPKWVKNLPQVLHLVTIETAGTGAATCVVGGSVTVGAEAGLVTLVTVAGMAFLLEGGILTLLLPFVLAFLAVFVLFSSSLAVSVSAALHTIFLTLKSGSSSESSN